ncbi:outer membrane protein assembly factor BamA [Caulobacter sp. S45]|jgi:outer membrane protein insertion porin family|uniref:outer membrane protein assembly factor BamA n=1 Tax=Caulobacter sp. S45 TaxID=1641861 RepID=UPI0020B12648|nr:outer membrane protein assembly factor BamA [Caulobacter sp. S45]
MLRPFPRRVALLSGMTLLLGSSTLATGALAQTGSPPPPGPTAVQSPSRPSPAPAAGSTAPDASQPVPAAADAAASATPPPPPPNQTGVVRAIRVQGNERIESDTIVSYMPLAVGDTIDAARIDLAVKTLFRTDLFSDVTVTLDPATGLLTVHVTENPIINRVVFEGNSAESDDKLRDEVSIHPRSIFTKSHVQQDVQRIVELYRRSGRISATVSPKIVELPQKRVDLVFEIKEGPKTGIIRVNFLGNRVFSDSALRDVVVTKESHWYKFFASNDNYDPDRIEYDREQLRKYYSNRGYYDFRVTSSIAELQSDQRNFAVTYTMDEGAKYKFGKLRVTTDLKRLNGNILRQLLPIKEGQVYAGDKIEQSVDALTFAAGAAGFAFVDIRPRYTANRDTHTVDVTFDIREGPRVYVERIDIVGNTRTLDPVIRREMRITEGDAYNRVLVDRSKTEVKRLDFFKTVDVTQQPGSAPDKTVLQVKVQEQPTGELSVGAGYSSLDKLTVDFGVSEHNFRGMGQDLRLRADIGFLTQSVDLSYTEPRFLGRDLRAGVSLFDNRTDYSQFTGFISSTAGASVHLLFPLNINASFAPHYSLHQDSVSADAGNCEAGLISIVICDQRGESLTSAPGYELNLDLRNDPLHPTRGFTVGFSQDFAGVGGNVRYLRTDTNVNYYYGFTPAWVVTLNADVTYIHGWGGDSIRINDRLFKGGNTFPGFEIAGIGPRDTEFDEALGGNLSAIGSASLSFPNYLPEQYGIRTSYFADVGTLGLLDKSVLRTSTFIRDDLALRASTGISVFWTSPLGPIRLDFAQVIKRESYDRTEAFRFSTATQFQ